MLRPATDCLQLRNNRGASGIECRSHGADGPKVGRVVAEPGEMSGHRCACQGVGEEAQIVHCRQRIVVRRQAFLGRWDAPLHLRTLDIISILGACALAHLLWPSGCAQPVNRLKDAAQCSCGRCNFTVKTQALDNVRFE